MFLIFLVLFTTSFLAFTTYDSYPAKYQKVSLFFSFAFLVLFLYFLPITHIRSSLSFFENSAAKREQMIQYIRNPHSILIHTFK